MSNIVINGTTYNGIESITVKDTSGSDVKYTKGERPSGTIEITENGTYDVTDYESANVNVEASGGTDRLQWKCDNMKSLQYEFCQYQGTDYSILEGLDTSQVTDISNMFAYNSNATSMPLFDTSNVTNMLNLFYSNYYLQECPQYNTSQAINMSGVFYNCEKITQIPLLDTGNATDMSSFCRNCKKLTQVPVFNQISNKTMNGMFFGCALLESITLLNTHNANNVSSAFYGCKNLISISNFDIYGVIGSLSANATLTQCSALTNLTLKNIRTNFTIGSGTSYGHLLTNASLLNTAQELWDNTGNAVSSSALKLTMATPSKTAIQSIYVKLIDVTDEMITQDQYIANKKPCVECASTDEGAMTLEEYIISKNWQIA